MSRWNDLIDFYRDFNGVSHELKVATLAQWILESARGGSKLARDHLNFGGLKYRARMKAHATAVDYTGSDGELATYCGFGSVKDFVLGYWHFVDSGPYDGWDSYGDDAAGYIQHLVKGGYSADPGYFAKVLALLDEAAGLLHGSAGVEQHVANGALARCAVVVGHNSVARGAKALPPIGRFEFDFNSQVAAAMKREAAEFNLQVEVFLRQAGGGYTAEINAAYAKVASWGADCALELHFNSTPAAKGTEILHRRDSKDAKSLAAHLQQEVLSLYGFKDRGLKAVPVGARGAGSLYALKSVPTALAEPFFGDNATECAKVAELGIDALALAYLRGVRDWAVEMRLNSQTLVAANGTGRTPAEMDGGDV